MNTSMIAGSFFLFYFLIMAASALSIVAQILIGVAINRDAHALGLPQGKLFMILTIFLGGIPAGIYFIIRSNKIVSEGGANFAPSAKMAKVGMILYIISFVFIAVLLCFYFNWMLTMMAMTM